MSPARHPVRALVPCADARARRPGRRQHQGLREAHEAARGGRVRRHRHEAADAELKQRRRGADRDAGPAARPHRGEERVLNQVEYVVLDEADRMLDIGFLPDLQRILVLPAEAARRRCCSRRPSRPRSGGSPKATCRTRCWSRWRGRTRPRPTSSSTSTASMPTTSGARCCKLLKERSICRRRSIFVNSKIGCEPVLDVRLARGQAILRTAASLQVEARAGPRA